VPWRLSPIPPTKDITGKVVAVKERTALKAGEGSHWPSGKHLLVYGEHRLEDATRAGYLVLVEGETCSLTLWFHGEPALGIPGAGTVAKTLHQGHVAAHPLIYVVEEADASGKDFVKNVVARLAALGWQGELKVVRLGVKDVSEMHALVEGRHAGRDGAADRTRAVRGRGQCGEDLGRADAGRRMGGEGGASLAGRRGRWAWHCCR
jgi:hypothetical protein